MPKLFEESATWEDDTGHVDLNQVLDELDLLGNSDEDFEDDDELEY
jgi:hypothetical protein